MFSFYLPNQTWIPVTIVRWLVGYGPFIYFMNKVVGHPLAKTLWSPFILLTVAIALHWLATVGVNSVFRLTPKTREYIEWQQRWVISQRGSGVSKRDNVFGDTGELGAFLLLVFSFFISALMLIAYVIDGPKAL